MVGKIALLYLFQSCFCLEERLEISRCLLLCVQDSMFIAAIFVDANRGAEERRRHN